MQMVLKLYCHGQETDPPWPFICLFFAQAPCELHKVYAAKKHAMFRRIAVSSAEQGPTC